MTLDLHTDAADSDSFSIWGKLAQIAKHVLSSPPYIDLFPDSTTAVVTPTIAAALVLAQALGLHHLTGNHMLTCDTSCYQFVRTDAYFLVILLWFVKYYLCQVCCEQLD